jgi:hypothetical protein
MSFALRMMKAFIAAARNRLPRKKQSERRAIPKYPDSAPFHTHGLSLTRSAVKEEKFRGRKNNPRVQIARGGTAEITIAREE